MHGREGQREDPGARWDGSNNTAEAVRLTKAAKDIGADGVLVISPYYNKPNRAGLIKHYTKIADLDIPVVVYNFREDRPEP